MIYLDHAATTQMRQEVLDAMLPYLRENYYNPSALYRQASAVASAIRQARDSVASLIGAKNHEIFFCSGGTEADNWALEGALTLGATSMRLADGRVRDHIITSSIEHPAVANQLRRMEKEGRARVSYLPVDGEGFVLAQDLKDAMREETILVSVMTANNEIGTIEPIAELCQIAHQGGALFHTDAVQAFGQIPLNVRELGVDLLSASGHKIYGPKGIGMLFIHESLPFRALLQGGAQEKNRRPGTENVPGIVGFGAAAKYAKLTLADRMEKERRLRDEFLSKLEDKLPQAILHGPRGDKRLPGNINIALPGKLAELMLIRLDAKGIMASAGSACSSGSLDPSPVLAALGLSEEENRASLRFSLGADSQEAELDQLLNVLEQIMQS